MAGSDYYDHTTYPPANTVASSQALRNEFELVEAGFAKLPALTGTANMPVFIKPDGTGLTAAAQFPDTTDGNASTSAHGLVPKLPGSALVFYRGDGTWAAPGGGSAMNLVTRTSNTQFTSALSGTLVDITSGTFTQTFDPVANLAAGWFIFLRNSGTGDITLDPNGAELIDGLTSYIMYPGEVRLIQCDATKLTSYVIAPFTKEFTASGNFIKPPGYRGFDLEMWGAGGGGSGGTTTGGSGAGGAGGGYFRAVFAASSLGTSTAVSIGAGGNGSAGTATNTSSNGTTGGNSTFGGTLMICGGGPGGTSSSVAGGAGAGVTAAPYVGASSTAISGGGAFNGNNSVYGGGGGGGGNYSAATSGTGGTNFSGTATAGVAVGNGLNGAPFCGGSGGAQGSPGGNGGNGGTAAGGGGGGKSGTLGGNGGRGGDGYAIIRGV